MLIVFAGLPGTGKSSIAREVARERRAVWLRIDTVEQALLDQSAVHGIAGGTGYEVCYRIAEDNLRIGDEVVADCVNPWPLTRDAWRGVANRAGVGVMEIETICSDLEEHRRRIETRSVDVPGLKPPSWREVMDRDYRPWDRDHLIVDTAHEPLSASVARVLGAIAQHPH